jgi:hypothetical protein
MADKPPGEWGTLTFSLPEGFDDIRVAINGVADFILAGLNIAVEALNLVKTLTLSYLNPVAAIVQAIVDELKALARSLEQIGIYITGDWNLLEYPYPDLRGGFAEYERRMIARLTDRTDPTRPDASSSITTFAAFTYLSVERAGIDRLLAFIEQITQFFNLSISPKGGLPTPTIGEVYYGNDATNILNFDSLTNLAQFNPSPPSLARITWKVSPPTSDLPFKPFPPLPPTNYLITVSTLPDGIPLVYDRPRSDTDTKDGKSGEKVQPRDTGKVIDRRGKQVVLHGGVQMLEFDAKTYGWNNALDSDGNLKNGSARVYGVLDNAKNSIIPLEELLHSTPTNDFPLFQRTYTPDEIEASLQWATDEFSFDIPFDQMPWHADIEMEDGRANIVNVRRPANYYVRIASTGPNSYDENRDEPYRNRFIWDLASEGAKANATASGPFIITVGEGDDKGKGFTLSEWSKPKMLTFSDASTGTYLEALKTALLLLVLCRVDLVVIDELDDVLTPDVIEAAKEDRLMLPDVALKATGLEQFRHLVDAIYGDIDGQMKSTLVDPSKFRRDLLDRITQVATDIYQTTGPMPAAEAAVVDATEMLRTVTWSKILLARGDEATAIDPVGSLVAESFSNTTILGSLTYNSDLDGVALNPYCTSNDVSVINDLYFFESDPKVKVFKNRSPHFIEVGVQGGAGLADLVAAHPLVPKDEAEEVLATLPSGLRLVYENYIDEEGDIAIEPEAWDWLLSLEAVKELHGSADRSPVFFYGGGNFSRPEAVRANTVEITFCRTVLAEYENGQLMQEAALVLNVAAAAHQRSPSDGAWLALRIGDVLPQLDGFVDSIVNWIEAIQATIETVADALVAYIDYVIARIVDIQQMIRRINALLTTAFSLAFDIPKVAGLVLTSAGTDGVLTDFASAANKPADSPLSYGAGIAIVAPTFPSFLQELFNVSDDPAEGTALSPDAITPIFGIEDISQEDLNPPSDPEPDVL